MDAVETELSLGTIPQLRFRMSREKGDLIVQTPSSRAREMVETTSKDVGEKGYVSGADRDVVALALDLKESGLEPLIVSDDYAVQNLADYLGLRYGSLANFGIIHRFRWVMYCPACHRRFRPPEKSCRVCGTDLRRKVLSKTRVARSDQPIK